MVEVEGARLLVCEKCRKFGAEIRRRPSGSRIPHSVQSQSKGTPTTAKQSAKAKPGTAKTERIWRPRTEQRAKTEKPKPTEYELVDDYPKQIRQAREALKLTQGELAQRLGERLSIIQKLETGKIRPSDALAEKIDRTLRINLTAPIGDEIETQPFEKSDVEITIGDIAKSVTKKKPSSPA